MSKYIVGVLERERLDQIHEYFMELEASSPLAAAEKFASAPDSPVEVEDDDVIIVAENVHKFKVSFKKTVKLILSKKSGKNEPIV